MENKDTLLDGSTKIIDILKAFVDFETLMLAEKEKGDIDAVNGLGTTREKFLISLQGAITRDNVVIKEFYKNEKLKRDSSAAPDSVRKL